MNTSLQIMNGTLRALDTPERDLQPSEPVLCPECDPEPHDDDFGPIDTDEQIRRLDAAIARYWKLHGLRRLCKDYETIDDLHKLPIFQKQAE